MNINEVKKTGYLLANETLSIHSKELRFYRCILRLFGFWHPMEACFIERIIYPLLINMLLFGILVLEVYSIVIHSLQHSIDKRAMFTLETSTSISRYIWAWLCHTLAVQYFKGRNLERKLLNLEIGYKYRKEFNKMIRSLDWIVAASISQGVISFILSIVAGEYLSYPSRWIPDNERRHETNTTNTKHDQFFTALTLLISISDLYIVPILLCLTWLMYLLTKSSRIRLLQLKNEYTSWNKQAEQAIFRHYTYYTKHVKSSCKALQLLFISHNVFMVIMTPQQFYICVEVSRNKGALDLAIFLYYFLMLMVIWITPLYLAESLRREEGNFVNDINNFCPNYIELYCAEKESEDECCALGTFQSRREVSKLTSYLKDRKSGFLVGFYSFQLQLSMVSFYVGLLMFVIRTMPE